MTSYGYQLTVYTDHAALLHLFKGKNLSGRLARWFVVVDEFNPTIKYLPDKANETADALSRTVTVACVRNNYFYQEKNFLLPSVKTLYGLLWYMP